MFEKHVKNLKYENKVVKNVVVEHTQDINATPPKKSTSTKRKMVLDGHFVYGPWTNYSYLLILKTDIYLAFTFNTFILF